MIGRDFDTFKGTVERELMRHPVVTDNAYTAWFSEGRMPLDHLRHFTVQFSVFSNQFLLAALNRVINADTPEAAREGRVISQGPGRGRSARWTRGSACRRPRDGRERDA